MDISHFFKRFSELIEVSKMNFNLFWVNAYERKKSKAPVSYAYN